MYFIAFNSRCNGYSKFKTSKYDACIVDCVADSKYYGKSRFLNKCYYWLCRKLNFPEIVPYSNYVKTCIEFFKSHDDVIPCIVPNYDHTPRSKRAGMLLHKSTPEKWKSLLQSVKKIIDNKTIKSSNKNLIFIKAWNEWAEGNYLEPDCVYGCSYLEKIKEIFK